MLPKVPKTSVTRTSMKQVLDHLFLETSKHELKLMNGSMNITSCNTMSHNTVLYLNFISLTNCTVTSIARDLGVNKSAVTLKIKELEEKGLVRRVKCEADKRISYLQLTEKAQMIYQDCDTLLQQAIIQAEQNFSTEEISSFIKVTEFFCEFYRKLNYPKFDPDSPVATHLRTCPFINNDVATTTTINTSKPATSTDNPQDTIEKIALGIHEFSMQKHLEAQATQTTKDAQVTTGSEVSNTTIANPTPTKKRSSTRKTEQTTATTSTSKVAKTPTNNPSTTGRSTTKAKATTKATTVTTNPVTKTTTKTPTTKTIQSANQGNTTTASSRKATKSATKS